MGTPRTNGRSYNRLPELHPQRSARQAGLRYVSDAAPGMVREGPPGAFRYRRPNGRVLREAAALRRIRSLAIPPAWQKVWVCAREDGHLQATGRDARGRKQSRYHGRWREVRDDAKHGRVREFGRVLPRLRGAVERDLRCDCLCREAVMAAVVLLMDRGRFRIGNDEYTRANGSHGACTLEDGNVRVRGGTTVCFDFVGKGGVRRATEIKHSELARLVRRCRALPGRRLFQYRTPRGSRPVAARDVNAYIRQRTQGRFSAKDFRTWHASRLCARLLGAVELPAAERARRRVVSDAIKQVAAQLGNTPAVCRRSYIDPEVIAGFLRAA